MWEATVDGRQLHFHLSGINNQNFIIGVSFNGRAKAYPLSVLQKQSPIIDIVGDVPFLLVIGEDKKSVRGFERLVDGRMLEFFAKSGASPLCLVDAETGSEWDFTGKATSGPLAGKQLQKTPVLSDYWFDWKAYHPDTDVISRRSHR